MDPKEDWYPIDALLVLLTGLASWIGPDETLVYDRGSSLAAHRAVFDAGEAYLSRYLGDPSAQACARGETCTIKHFQIDHLPLVVVRPREQIAKRRRLVLQLHYGGTVLGKAVDPLTFLLAQELDAIVVSPDYRLAPENPYPKGLEDCFAALMWMSRPSEDRDALLAGAEFQEGPIVVGTSAGGLFASVLGLKAREAKIPIKRLVLFQPMLSPVAIGAGSLRDYDSATLTAKQLTWMWKMYAPDLYACARDPHCTPLASEDLSGLPPVLIVVSSRDVLRGEGEALHARLKASGTDAKLRVVRGSHAALSAKENREQSIKWLLDFLRDDPPKPLLALRAAREAIQIGVAFARHKLAAAYEKGGMGTEEAFEEEWLNLRSALAYYETLQNEIVLPVLKEFFPAAGFPPEEELAALRRLGDRVEVSRKSPRDDVIHDYKYFADRLAEIFRRAAMATEPYTHRLGRREQVARLRARFQESTANPDAFLEFMVKKLSPFPENKLNVFMSSMGSFTVDQSLRGKWVDACLGLVVLKEKERAACRKGLLLGSHEDVWGDPSAAEET